MKEFGMMLGAVVLGAIVVDFLAGMGWTPGEMIAERKAAANGTAGA